MEVSMKVLDAGHGPKAPDVPWSDPPASQTVTEGVALVQWRAQVPSARQRWARCSESELLRCNGDRLRLAGLVQRRYALSGAAAAREVQSFLDLKLSR